MYKGDHHQVCMLHGSSYICVPSQFKRSSIDRCLEFAWADNINVFCWQFCLLCVCEHCCYMHITWTITCSLNSRTLQVNLWVDLDKVYISTKRTRCRNQPNKCLLGVLKCFTPMYIYGSCICWQYMYTHAHTLMANTMNLYTNHQLSLVSIHPVGQIE